MSIEQEDRGRRSHALLSNEELRNQIEQIAGGRITPSRTDWIERRGDELLEEQRIRHEENRIEPGVPLEELRDLMERFPHTMQLPFDMRWMYQSVDEDFQDKNASDDIFEQAWGIAKESEDDDDMFQDLEPLPGFGESNDADKISQVQNIFDDIERRKHEEAEARRTKAEAAGPQGCKDCGDELDQDHWHDDGLEIDEYGDEVEAGYWGSDPEFGDRCEDCHYEDLMGYVDESDMEEYEGDNIWDDRWEISPPGGGWRMFSHGGSRDTNLPHLLRAGVDPEHLQIVNIGPRDHTPWGYLSGEDTVWMSKESPHFDRLMARYIEDEPEGYDPWERMA